MRQVWKLPPEERLGDMGPECFLVLLDSWDVEEVAALALIMWCAWSVRNKVTRAGEALSIDNSVDFLTSLANQLLMVNGHQGDGANAVRVGLGSLLAGLPLLGMLSRLMLMELSFRGREKRQLELLRGVMKANLISWLGDSSFVVEMRRKQKRKLKLFWRGLDLLTVGPMRPMWF
jgi:hypothetical protein